MLPGHLAVDPFIKEGGSSVLASFILGQRSVVSQNSRFSLPHEWPSLWGLASPTNVSALVKRNLCPNPFPCAGHKASRPGILRSCSPSCRSCGTSLWPSIFQAAAPLQVCMARLLRGQLCVYREKRFHSLLEMGQR